MKWPDEELIPGFRGIMETYLEEVEQLGYKFSSLLAEALGLGPKGLEHFYDTQNMMQHRGKIVKYPVVTGDNDQGVGPHYDSGFLTFVSVPKDTAHRVNLLIYSYQLLQASPHRGLQVQNLSGEWIDAPPIPGTFVINIGKGMSPISRSRWMLY
jgi:isopenicillin N synthase-like dioxygenase